MLKERFEFNMLQIKNLGIVGALKFKIFRLLERYKILKSPHFLTSKFAEHPILCRPYTSDLNVFHQIFIEREYVLLDNIQNVDLVIDCGANVGYSSAYFLTRFPKCRVIAVEPEISNIESMKINLESYMERAKIFHAGIWSHATDLKISEIPFGDGLEWSTQVRECSAAESPDVKAVDIETLLKASGKERVSILKVDIEGAEVILFSKNYESWLPLVDNIVIELHDNTYFGNASNIFFEAIKNRSFNITNHGELVLCRDQKSLNNNDPKPIVNDFYHYKK
jgi:FkbM family methyltransferase